MTALFSIRRFQPEALLCHSNAVADDAIALEWHPAEGSDLRPGRTAPQPKQEKP